jgi:hypothetical protein
MGGIRCTARHDSNEDHMVSDNLPEHISPTQMNNLARAAVYRVQRGSEATEAGRQAYEGS